MDRSNQQIRGMRSGGARPMTTRISLCRAEEAGLYLVCTKYVCMDNGQRIVCDRCFGRDLSQRAVWLLGRRWLESIRAETAFLSLCKGGPPLQAGETRGLWANDGTGKGKREKA